MNLFDLFSTGQDVLAPWQRKRARQQGNADGYVEMKEVGTMQVPTKDGRTAPARVIEDSRGRRYVLLVSGIRRLK